MRSLAHKCLCSCCRWHHTGTEQRGKEGAETLPAGASVLGGGVETSYRGTCVLSGGKETGCQGRGLTSLSWHQAWESSKGAVSLG